MNALMATAVLACSSKGDSSGYGVVDMMPEPARCSKDATPFISGTATGAKRPDGKWDVTLNLAVSDPKFQLKALEYTYSHNYEATATLALAPGGGTVTATVDPSSGSVFLTISLTCSGADAGPSTPDAGVESGRVQVEVVWKVDHLKDNPYAVTVRPI